MIVFKDIISGDEIFSDSFPYKLVDDIYYEIEGKMTTETTDISDEAIGGNASAEEPTEQAEAASQTGINFVLAMRLVSVSKPTTIKKFKVEILKPYLQAVKKKLTAENPDRVEKFQKGILKFVTERLDKNYADWDLYTGESMNPDAMHVMVNYREDGVTPYMVVFKDGVVEEKF
ncbi:uncharacterized protein [Oscarella lobularis]|uniref:uncharacterized protein n=1 Tax=Oscarella lobularis TaxID=121494 RepID=UPI0033143989